MGEIIVEFNKIKCRVYGYVVFSNVIWLFFILR